MCDFYFVINLILEHGVRSDKSSGAASDCSNVPHLTNINILLQEC